MFHPTAKLIPTSLLLVACYALLSLALLAPAAQAAGLRLIDVPADTAGPALTGAVWTPCASSITSMTFGFMTVLATPDCPTSGEHLPLVVISHGYGGWFLGHHDVAEALANAGFVVAAINHPVDSGRSSDRSHADELSAWTSRPADITRLIDYMLASWPDKARIDPARIGFFGFSRGGFTGLVLIGGNPDFQRLLASCPEYPGNRMCAQLHTGETSPISFAHDPRIRVAVLADPALGPLFLPDGLSDVTAPVQLWSSEQGGHGVSPADVAAVARTLPASPDEHVVPDAAHFAFLAPCSVIMAERAQELCTDAPGFDRVAFHAAMDQKVVAFFSTHLSAIP